ncbi:MAG: uracil-DNA glycosylase [Syntrophomonadaceae bacterium]
MADEQPVLFGELNPPPAAKIPSTAPPRSGAAFLPGLKDGEGYPDIKDYQQLQELARQCQRCILRSTCRQVVFGAGSRAARIMFVGEGPGKDEDEQGIPFVGRAGQLLDKILAAAEFNRPEVYITNVVKCRPPGNRLPNPDEVKACRPYLEAQIRLISPRLIVCLGSAATQAIIDPKARITQVHGRWFAREGIKMMATFHPAALLRNPSYKRPAWEDFKLIRDEYRSICGQA